jgi:D-alanine--poly(phosphoribitol) ligase subunit 1
MQINVLEQFNQTCLLWPSKPAVIDKAGEWNFATLRRRAHAISVAITGRVSETNCPIAVYLPKSREAVAAILGVLFSGNCYAPMDIKAPPSRITTVINHLGPVLILTTRELSQALSELNGTLHKVLILDDVPETSEDCPNLWKDRIDTDPVYIIHTSGSTGRPKGVVISHRGVIDYIDWARDCFKIDENYIIGNQAPLIFDNSTLDLYLCFFCGATLHLLPEDLFAFPLLLLEYLAKNSVNFIFWVPSVLVSAANKDFLQRVQGVNLTKILFAGEVMPARQLNVWRRRFPQALFANLYGPTEITVDCTFYILERDFEDQESIPIGKACRNTGILILNDRNELCAVGERGELCVRGTSLAHGYWNDPAQTAAAFVQNPLHNHYPEIIYRTGDLVYENDSREIIYVGRKDFQIKHLGHRIEIGDIENFVLRVPGVRNACVLYHQTKKEIMMIYESDTEIAPGVIRVELAKNLPKYMWPTSYRFLPKLPLNQNGKIDRQSLSAEYGK